MNGCGNTALTSHAQPDVALSACPCPDQRRQRWLKVKRKAGVLGQQLNEVQMEDGNGGGSTPAAKVDRFLLLPMTGRFVQEKPVPFFSDQFAPGEVPFCKRSVA